MINLIEINDDDFEQKVLKSDKLAIVDFWAPWCGPCRKLSPVLEQIQNEFGESIQIVKIDADKNTKTASDYGVSSLPSVLIFQKGELKEIMAGMMPKSAIITNIKKFLN